MFNFIKKLFTPKLSQIDKLIQFFGVESLSIWNGMNYCGEYMIPVTGRKPKDWKDPAYRWIKIGFGRYVHDNGDWECCSIIEVWIDRDLNIMRVNRNHPYCDGSPHRNEKLIDKLYDKMLDVRKFSSGHQKLNDWVGTLFKATPRSLYAHPIEYTGITTTSYPMLDYVLERLEEEEEKLAKEGALIGSYKFDAATTDKLNRVKIAGDKEAEIEADKYIREHGGYKTRDEVRLNAMKQDQSHDSASGAENVSEPRVASFIKEEDDIEAMFGIEYKKEKKKGKKKCK